MSGLLQDLRFAVRLLLRSPAYTAVGVLSLALGIGANTTIFSLLNGVFLHPLPVADPAGLVSVFTTDARNTGGFNDYLPTSRPNFEDYRDQNSVFSGVAAYQNFELSVAEAGEAEQVTGEMVSAGYFQLLGLTPRHGRVFTADEEREGHGVPVAILGHGYWTRRFGADPRVVGRTITLNRQPFTVVGVAPEGFKGTNAFAPPSVWVPMALHKPGPRGTTRSAAAGFISNCSIAFEHSRVCRRRRSRTACRCSAAESRAASFPRDATRPTRRTVSSCSSPRSVPATSRRWGSGA